MKITTICLVIVLACSCCHITDETHPGSTEEAMTRHDEIRKMLRNHWIHEFETVDDTYWSSAEEHKKAIRELRKMKKDYYYKSSDPNIPDVPGPAWIIRGQLTIEQIEQKSLERIRMSPSPDVPQVPFGYENDKWNKLKSQYKDGDEFYFFALDPRSSPSYYGTSGYVLIRDNQIVGLK
jgi:hypothetical protein